MRALVTGARGFVGRNVAERLSAPILLTRDDADLSRPLPPLPAADVVYHCAAEIDDVERMESVNVTGTSRLLDWAAASGVKVFVFVSTGGIKGDSVYASTKRRAEELVLQAASVMQVRIARLFFPYGAGQGSRRLVPRLVADIVNDRPVSTNEDGGPFLSLTHVSDTADAIVQLGLVQSGSHIADVGASPIPLREVLEVIGDVTGHEPDVRTNTTRSPDFIADPRALRELTGFEPQIKFRDGIRTCV